MTPCIEHNQKGQRMGYGMKNVRGKTMLYHRWVFLQEHGYLPSVVMHLCNNGRCINPDHLKAGTQKENLEMAWSSGRKRRDCGTPKKLTDAQAKLIREDPRTQRVIAAEYGICQQLVSLIKTGKAYLEVEK